jgi:hypothetical protein
VAGPRFLDALAAPCRPRWKVEAADSSDFIVVSVPGLRDGGHW